jgi:hypothetical protein
MPLIKYPSYAVVSDEFLLIHDKDIIAFFLPFVKKKRESPKIFSMTLPSLYYAKI